MVRPDVTGCSPDSSPDSIIEEQDQPPPRSRTRKHEKNKLPHIQRRAYRIVEFCAAHGVSRAKYYQLKKLGLGPHETAAGGVIIITEEDAARWRKQRSAASRTSRITRKSA
jgi:hypothetical protein